MSTALQALRNKPLAYFKLDGASPFPDLSGYGRTATSTSTTRAVGLGNDFYRSVVLSSSAMNTYDSPVFLRGQESQEFTLEAIVRVVGSSISEQQILSHQNTLDGLTIRGTRIAFSTAYSATGEARCEYDIQVGRRVHVAGVHTPTKNILYVDGEPVSEVAINTDQQQDNYVPTNGKLYSGYAAAAQTISINGVGIYGQALSDEDIRSNYNESIRTVDNPASILGGTTVPIYSQSSNLFLERTWTTREDWTGEEMSLVNIDGETLMPAILNDVPQAGYWISSVPLDIADSTSIHGVNMWWDGVGAIVEASLNGDTWTPVSRGVNLSITPQGFDPTNKILYIRVRFDGTNSEAYLDNLVVRGYLQEPVVVVSERVVTIGAGTNFGYERRPVELADDWGLNMINGSLTIGEDVIEQARIRTLEVWVKPRGSFSINRSGATLYRNGTIWSSALTTGDWQLLHYVYGSSEGVPMTLSGDAILGRVVFYDVPLSATQIDSIYRSYLGTKQTRINETDTIQVTEPADSVSIYAFDWSISTAG